MRLIDADRLLTERMMSKYYRLPNGDIAIPIIDIKNAKTVDAVEVVRCRDCKWWKKWARTCAWYSYSHIMIHADDFCSHGERKTDV